MSHHRPLRSTNDLTGTPLQQLELPTCQLPRRIVTTPNGPLEVATRSRSGFARSPSPRPQASPAEQGAERFNFELAPVPATTSTARMSPPSEPPGEDATIEEIREYAEQMRQQALSFANSLSATTSLLEKSLAINANQTTHKRKPELPPWDPKNLEAWIRRTENAFLRAGVKEPKDKFAFLESIISVDLHPSVNKFFSGTASQGNYDSFLAFLRTRYGRTKEQKVASALEGVRRNGRMPVDLMATIHERMDNVTIDDIKKAHLLRELPPSVREQLCPKADTLSPDELAAAADVYFQRDGSLKCSSNRSSVNSVTDTPATSREGYDAPSTVSTFTQPFSEEPIHASDVNAVGYRNNHIRTGAQSTQRGQRGGTRSRSRPRSSSSAASSNPSHCFFHQKWGTNARNCRQPCSFNSGSSNSSTSQHNNSNSGNGRGGRR